MTGIVLVLACCSLFAQIEVGYLDLTTEPSGVSIVVDGRPMGISPKKVPLLAGRHTVVLNLHGYETQTIVMDILDGVTSSRKVGLEKLYPKGNLRIEVHPPSAEVFVNNKVVGSSSPVMVNGLRVGSYSIRVKGQVGAPLNDELEVTEIAEVRQGQTTTLRVDLQSYIQQGTASFTTNAPTQTVIVKHLKFNKEYTITIPTNRLMIAGEYEIRWKDITDNKNSLTIRPSKLTEVFVPFQQALMPYKTLQDHPNYISFEEFTAGKFTRRPEQKTDNVKVWGSSTTQCLWLFTLPMAVLTAYGVSSWSAGLDVVMVGGTLLGIACVAVPWVGDTQIVEVPDDDAIRHNERAIESLKGLYDPIVLKWQNDINRENEKIKALNNETEERNKKLQPYQTIDKE